MFGKMNFKKIVRKNVTELGKSTFGRPRALGRVVHKEKKTRISFSRKFYH